MSKKCMICGDQAVFRIRDNSDYYCKSCAVENFSDISFLEVVETEALRLKELIKEKLAEEDVQKDHDRTD